MQPRPGRGPVTLDPAPISGQPRFGTVVQFEGGACPGAPSAPQPYDIGSDGRTLSVVFERFAAQTDTDSQVSCTFRIPVRVPAGRRLRLHAMDLHGTAAVSKGSLAGVTVHTTLFAGKTRAAGRAIHIIKDAESSAFRVQARTTERQNDLCGGAATLVVRTQIFAPSDTSNVSSLTLDSLYLDLRDPKHVTVEPCTTEEK